MALDELSGFSAAVSAAAQDIAEVNKTLQSTSRQEEIIAILMQQSENLKDLAENTDKALRAILYILARKEL